MKRLVLLSLFLALLVILIPSCVTVVQQPAGQPSVIFSSNPSAINPGGSSNLTWNVSGANSVSIDHGIGVVNASGTMAVSPAESTTYTISATNSTGTVNGYALVTGNPLAPSAASFLVTSVVVSISPSTFTGSCPRTFTLNGSITANAPGTITYRWERDDIRYSDVQSMTFTAAGTQTTTKLWDFGETSSGSIKLHVLTDDVSSVPVSYSLTCSN